MPSDTKAPSSSPEPEPSSTAPSPSAQRPQADFGTPISLDPDQIDGDEGPDPETAGVVGRAVRNADEADAPNPRPAR